MLYPTVALGGVFIASTAFADEPALCGGYTDTAREASQMAEGPAKQKELDVLRRNTLRYRECLEARGIINRAKAPAPKVKTEARKSTKKSAPKETASVRSNQATSKGKRPAAPNPIPVEAPRDYIVAQNGQADFTTIQEAINKAGDNDTIWVRAGPISYASFNTFEKKGLQITGIPDFVTGKAPRVNATTPVELGFLARLDNFFVETLNCATALRINTSNTSLHNNQFRSVGSGLPSPTVNTFYTRVHTPQAPLGFFQYNTINESCGIALQVNGYLRSTNNLYLNSGRIQDVSGNRWDAIRLAQGSNATFANDAVFDSLGPAIVFSGAQRASVDGLRVRSVGERYKLFQFIDSIARPKISNTKFAGTLVERTKSYNSFSNCTAGTTCSSIEPAQNPNSTPNLDFFVDDSGGQPYSKIGDALAAATEGSIIWVYPGTYNENLIIAKNVTLRGIPDPVTGAKPKMTSSSTVTLQIGANATVVNLDIENLNGEHAVTIIEKAPMLIGNKISNKSSSTVGYAALAITNGQPYFESNLIVNNVASDHPAVIVGCFPPLSCTDAINGTAPKPTFVRNIIASSNGDAFVFQAASTSTLESNLVSTRGKIPLRFYHSSTAKITGLRIASSTAVQIWSAYGTGKPEAIGTRYITKWGE